MRDPITVALVEDQKGFRQALEETLSRQGHVRCVGSFANGAAALEKLRKSPPEVVIVDLHLPQMSGIEVTERLKAAVPSVKILILTAFEEPENIFAALRAGADGYLLKDCVSDRIIAAVEEVLSGGAPMSSQVAAQVVRYFQRAPSARSVTSMLTPRENEVLQLLAKGLAYKEIADQLGITFQTVSSHLKNIYEKLHVRSRAEAVSKLHQSR